MVIEHPQKNTKERRGSVHWRGSGENEIKEEKKVEEGVDERR
jgi:hypothetical protein